MKHITFKLPPQYPDISRTYAPFPNLKSVVLKGDGCLIQPQCLLSGSLEELEVDLRGTRDATSDRYRSHMLAQTLESVPQLATTLQKLRIKGFMSAKLDHTILSFSSLRSLVLLTGSSLSAGTLAALGCFPNLQDVYIHASHISAEDFTEAISTHSRSQPFPALRSLRIRAQRSLFRAILDVIPRGSLQSLYLETEEPVQGPSAWNPTLTLIALKAADTLFDLTLDQILDPEEIEATLSTSGADTRFALETLQPLSTLRALRRLTIDAMFLPDFTDRDIDQMATWWPRLEHLDLGELSDVQEHSEAPKLTVQALRYLAKRCPSLRDLAVPLDTSTCKAGADDHEKKDDKPVRQRALERLYVGPPPADEHISAFVRSVIDTFPCVKQIECTSPGKSFCVEVQTVFKAQSGEVEHRKGTSDGFANGQ